MRRQEEHDAESPLSEAPAEIGIEIVAREIQLLRDTGEVTFTERGASHYANFLALAFMDAQS